MRAVLLTGGFGTRMRPLSLSKPKSLIPFCNRPILDYQLEALSRAGVTSVISTLSGSIESFRAEFCQLAEKYGLAMEFVVESRPLGTGGAIRLATQTFQGEEPFFVLNADVVCNYPLLKMLQLYKNNAGPEAVIAVTRVPDPQHFGVCLFDSNSGRVEKFVEKPCQKIGDYINAGIYLLAPNFLQYLEEGPCSIERDVFPRAIDEGRVFCQVLIGPWSDIGHPSTLWQAAATHMTWAHVSPAEECPKETRLCQTVLMDPTAKADRTSEIGPNVVVGPRCQIGPGCRLANCVLLEDTVVGEFSYVAGHE